MSSFRPAGLPLFAAALLAFAALLPWAGQAGAASDDEGWSPAQIAVFGTPHLGNIEQPSTLHYAFSRSGSGTQAFDDSVDMKVIKVMEDGTRDLDFRYFTGQRAKKFGTIEGFKGNPLIMAFLQWDVEEMKEETGGGTRYLRNRIRYAFYDAAEVEEATVELNGRSLPATRVTIRPFVDNSHNAELGDYRRKLYEFLLSPEVPGGLYSIRTLVPEGEGAGGKAKIEDRLVFTGVDS